MMHGLSGKIMYIQETGNYYKESLMCQGAHTQMGWLLVLLKHEEICFFKFE